MANNIMYKDTEIPQEYKLKKSKSVDSETFKYNLLDIENIKVNVSTQYSDMKPVIRVGESTFGVNGDISFVSGLPKAGKSTITRFMIATALMKEVPESCDTISIRSEYCKGKKVIYLDTEQNPSDTQKMINSILEIAGLNKQPENLIVLNLRPFSHSDNMEYLRTLFHHYNDAYLWIIDGVTDFLPSANDETASNEIVRYLMRMSYENDTCIVCLIHENGGGGNGKMRGHIGSEAARKCQGAISIKYEEEKKVHSITSTHLRGSKRIDPIYWHFNEKGKPVSCSAEIIEKIEKLSEDKYLNKKYEYIQILDEVYKNIKGIGLQSDELKRQISIHAPKPKSTISKDGIRKRNDRLFEGITKSSLLRIEDEKRDGIDRKIYYYESPNPELKF
ncbi:hypothetical protein VB776_04505 [Arcicella sp. DC2W]|uniref:AAA family ATPase n=1 Tax=Arcicella gelida TaxID=2984195 RepID=A0ABU5S158_9BACT|nr:hypothetical protein [Arcicella sp. DC2W]MEA5402159.1 hypothetical protein [Arcicella sp. DC2W]